MAKSKYEQAHENDLAIIAEALAEAKQEHDLCSEGFRDFVIDLNNRLSKPLDVDVCDRQGGQITLELDVEDVPIDYMREMTAEHAQRLEDILHEAAAGYLDAIGSQLNSTNLSTDLWHD